MGYYTRYELSYQILKEEDEIAREAQKFRELVHNASIPIPKFINLDPSRLEERLEAALDDKDASPYGPLGDFVSGQADSCKWYDHKDDMLAFSAKFPTVLFTLKGEGEEPGDLWIKYFLGGRVQVAKAQIIYEKFDKKKLK